MRLLDRSGGRKGQWKSGSCVVVIVDGSSSDGDDGGGDGVGVKLDYNRVAL